MVCHVFSAGDVNAIVALLDEENIKNPQGYTYDAQDSQDLHPFRHSLDTPDHCGNTPLLLAVKLGYVQLAKLLIAEGFQCDITSKLHVALAYSETSTSELSASASPLLIQEGPEFHLLDECVLLRSIPLIKAVYQQLQRNTYTLWLEKRKKVLQTLLKIPDFYVELNWEFMGAGEVASQTHTHTISAHNTRTKLRLLPSTVTVACRTNGARGEDVRPIRHIPYLEKRELASTR